MRGDCLSPGRVNKAVVVSDNHPALLRARRRKERWSEEDARLYRRHRWRSEGFHGETKAWHGLARAVRRGLQNMRIQAFLTAAAINLKRLAAALLAMLFVRRTSAPTSPVVRSGRIAKWTASMRNLSVALVAVIADPVRILSSSTAPRGSVARSLPAHG